MGKKPVNLSILAGAGFFCGLILYFVLLPGWPRPDQPAYPIKKVKQTQPDLENILVYCPAESLLIFSFDQANNCLKLTSLDARSELELAGKKSNLTGLYEQGGMGLLLNSLNDLLGLDLQKYVLLDTLFLAEFIDLTGGLKVDLAAGDLEFINACLPEGPHLVQSGRQSLTGSQAICWAQAAPDRQPELLPALLSKAAGWQLPLFLKLADSRQLAWQTNLTLPDILRLGRPGLAREIFWHEIPVRQPGQDFTVNWQEEKAKLGRFLAKAGEEAKE